MPLVGVVDPSHKEMASDTMGRLPGWLPLKAALVASEDEKWSPWSWELLHAMFSEYQDRQDRITASALVSHCTRADIIKRKEDYVEDLESMYVPFRGTMVHRTMELYSNAEAIAEHRFYTTVDGGVTISCSPDLLTRTTLTDYKLTENPPRYNYPWANHSEQVQFNAFIVRNSTKVTQTIGGKEIEVPYVNLPFDPTAFPATKLQLLYMAPKFVKTLVVEKTTDYFDFKKGKEVRGKQPFVMSDDEVLTLLEPRVEMFKAALEAYPDWPEGAEQVWGGERGWSCPGYPLCKLPNCLAKRWPNRLVW